MIKNLNKELGIKIIFLLSIILILRAGIKEYAMFSEWQNNGIYVVGKVVSKPLPSGRFQEKIKVKFILDSREREVETYSFSPKKNIPNVGKKCLIVVGKKNMSLVGLVLNFDASSFEYGKNLTSAIDKSKIKIPYLGSPKYKP